VRDVQRRLASAGFGADGDPTGTYGPGTEAAVRRFQERRGLRVDGVCGPQTWDSLVEAGHPPHGTVNGVKCRHEVIVEPASALGSALGTRRGIVSSSHHQAVDRVGEGLAVAARSEDGVVEALETPRPGGGFDVLLVQWHPERMDGGESPLSGGIRNLFFQSITTTSHTS